MDVLCKCFEKAGKGREGMKQRILGCFVLCLQLPVDFENYKIISNTSSSVFKLCMDKAS